MTSDFSVNAPFLYSLDASVTSLTACFYVSVRSRIDWATWTSRVLVTGSNEAGPSIASIMDQVPADVQLAIREDFEGHQWLWMEQLAVPVKEEPVLRSLSTSRYVRA
jgi:hypothetical protein